MARYDGVVLHISFNYNSILYVLLLLLQILLLIYLICIQLLNGTTALKCERCHVESICALLMNCFIPPLNLATTLSKKCLI